MTGLFSDPKREIPTRCTWSTSEANVCEVKGSNPVEKGKCENAKSHGSTVHFGFDGRALRLSGCNHGSIYVSIFVHIRNKFCMSYYVAWVNEFHYKKCVYRKLKGTNDSENG